MFKRLNLRSPFSQLNVYSLFALAGIIGPIVLGIADLTAGISATQYNLFRHSISSLALTRLGWVQTIGFLVIGLLTEVFVAGLLFSIRGRRGFRFSIAILVWFGFGLLLVGAFNTDPVGGVHTIAGTIHGIAAKTIFILFPIACFLLLPSLKRDRRWRRLFVYTAVTGGIAAILVIIGFWLPEETNWFGLYERMMVWDAIAWLEVMSVRLFLLSRHRGHKMLIRTMILKMLGMRSL